MSLSLVDPGLILSSFYIFALYFECNSSFSGLLLGELNVLEYHIAQLLGPEPRGDLEALCPEFWTLVDPPGPCEPLLHAQA